jgi:hypothetical protein
MTVRQILNLVTVLANHYLPDYGDSEALSLPFGGSSAVPGPLLVRLSPRFFTASLAEIHFAGPTCKSRSETFVLRLFRLSWRAGASTSPAVMSCVAGRC